jgi:5-methyltetrahydropteroyltriglutamate--homocysteine methyltransferase
MLAPRLKKRHLVGLLSKSGAQRIVDSLPLIQAYHRAAANPLTLYQEVRMSQPRQRPPFRADHVGSLLRPKELFDARAAWHAGRLPYTALRRIEDDYIIAAVGMQESVGLRSITDGDYRRDDWFLDFMFSLRGITRGTDRTRVPFSGGVEFLAPMAKVTGKVRCPSGGISVDDFRFLKSATTRTPKFCLPAPSMFHTVITRDSVDPKIYPEMESFWADLARAYSDAVGHLVAAGCTYLQIDDVNSANIADANWQAFWRGRQQKPEALVDSFIALNNTAVENRPRDVTAMIHMCRGNYQSQWTAQGSYEMVAERYFNQSKVDGFFLEYDDERSGDFAPLRFMPKDKIVVLGLITSKRPELESKDDIRRRIDAAAKYIPLERLCISPQCGFASTQEGNRLSQEEQRAKLSLLVEIATEVWGGV